MSTQSECSICLDTVTGEETKLECNHTFHKTCIQTWFQTKQECPICRSTYTVVEIEDLPQKCRST